MPRGYAHEIVDVRGCNDSQGVYDLFGAQEQQDLYDIIERVGEQPWCNGNVGSYYDLPFTVYCSPSTATAV